MKAIRISLIIYITCLVLSKGLLLLLSDGNPANDIQLSSILGTSPMPPLPLYMISGSSLAICLISICIIISMKFEQNVIIQSLKKTGQLALTFYVAHVVIGLVLIDIVNPSNMGQYSIKFTVLYAVGFSLLCILFAVIWTRNHKSGPLEWLMRKITD